MPLFCILMSVPFFFLGTGSLITVILQTDLFRRQLNMLTRQESTASEGHAVKNRATDAHQESDTGLRLGVSLPLDDSPGQQFDF